MSIIELNSINKSFNNIKVLNNISIKINEAQRVVILGPSGCGKSTILRLIAGLSIPSSGDILISGEIVSKKNCIVKEPENRNIGMVFQDLALWPHFSVEENIEFGLKVKKVKKERRNQLTLDILKLVDMQNYANRKPSQLSGGQQQRVAIARALVLKPQILLMDEALASLDTKLNIQIRKEILKLQQQLKFTLIYVTHSYDEAFDIATRILILDDGEIKYDGSVDESKKYLLKQTKC